MAEGPIVPVINGTVGRWLLPREKATATGLWMAGIPMGVVLGNIFSAYIIESWGWRSVFYLFGGGGVLLAIVTWYFLRDEPAQHPMITPEEKNLIISNYPVLMAGTDKGFTFGQLVKDHYLWINSVANFLLGLLFWANLNWLLPILCSQEKRRSSNRAPSHRSRGLWPLSE
jgi:ACS family glucarate transporter-like MFS transporter